MEFEPEVGAERKGFVKTGPEGGGETAEVGAELDLGVEFAGSAFEAGGEDLTDLGGDVERKVAEAAGGREVEDGAAVGEDGPVGLELEAGFDAEDGAGLGLAIADLPPAHTEPGRRTVFDIGNAEFDAIYDGKAHFETVAQGVPLNGEAAQGEARGKRCFEILPEGGFLEDLPLGLVVEGNPGFGFADEAIEGYADG